MIGAIYSCNVNEGGKKFQPFIDLDRICLFIKCTFSCHWAIFIGQFHNQGIAGVKEGKNVGTIDSN